MTAEDRPITAARRLGRRLADFGRPFVWLFALLAVALVAFPVGGTFRVTVEDGQWDYAVISTDSPLGPWHPRAVRVDWLGEEVLERFMAPDGTDEEPIKVTEEEARLWELLELHVPWFDNPYDEHARPADRRLGFVAGRSAGWRYSFDGTRGSDSGGVWDQSRRDLFRLLRSAHQVHGFAVSLWPLLAAAALAGFVSRWRAVRRRERGETVPAPGLPRRLGRTWLRLAAALGLWLVAAVGMPLGEVEIESELTRNDFDGLHPRALAVRASGDLPALLRGSDGGWTRPWLGLRWSPGVGGRRAYASGAVSLWWLAAVGLAANAVTLRRARRGSSAAGDGTESTADDAPPRPPPA